MRHGGHPAGVPVVVAAEWEWQLRGSCRGHPVETFYPDDERGADRSAAVARAKAICGGCAVLAQCRSFALKGAERWGIWGALTARERAELSRPGAAQ